MKQKNLWIAALALGITLSAHGQQSGGGISPTMLQQIKQSYQGTPADKAIRNAITNNDINKLAVNGESKNNLDTYFSNKVEMQRDLQPTFLGPLLAFHGIERVPCAGDP